MARQKNFLLRFGERLQSAVTPSRGGGPKWKPYGFIRARARISPRVAAVASDLQRMPPEAFPDDQAVALLTMHPSFLAKSYFPSELLRDAKLQLIGSRPARVSPETAPPRAKGAELVTSELFVSSSRSDFQEWARELPRWTDRSGHAQITRLEDVRLPVPKEKVRGIALESTATLRMEVVLHAGPDADWVIQGFERYLKTLGAVLGDDTEDRIQVGGLTYLAVHARARLAEQIAAFAFLRAVRPMPQLRDVWPVKKESTAPVAMEFPQGPPQDPTLKVALFDGGIAKGTPLDPWVTRFRFNRSAAQDPELLSHGLAVTSAALFGPVEEGSTLQPPFASADHYHVFDGTNDIYRVLRRIRTVLKQRPEYRFVNLSIGPRAAIVDEDVDSWTAVVDELLSSGQVFATVATGNDGERDFPSGLARIQPPSDSVNALSVGACDDEKKWGRAPYSSYGPGRTPGRIKPDGVIFGGTKSDPFNVAGDAPETIRGAYGTSIAAPHCMHMALGMRAMLGDVLQPLATKALLVHCARRTRQPLEEVGWGRFEGNFDTILTCPPGTARILYQGVIDPGTFMRLPIPVPASGLSGQVKLSATFCYATKVDPQDPLAYTRAGLDIFFRPNKEQRPDDRPDSQEAETQGFFRRPKVYQTEQQLVDAHRWDTTRHATRSFRNADLDEPCFDVFHNARASGQPTDSASSIPYALALTITCSAVPALYDLILQRYRTQLQPLRPVLQIQIQSRS